MLNSKIKAATRFIFGNPPTGSGFAGFSREATAAKKKILVSLTWHQEPQKDVNLDFSLSFLFLWLGSLAIKKIIIKQSGITENLFLGSKRKKKFFCVFFRSHVADLHRLQHSSTLKSTRSSIAAWWREERETIDVKMSFAASYRVFKLQQLCNERNMQKKWISRWRCVKKSQKELRPKAWMIWKEL